MDFEGNASVAHFKVCSTCRHTWDDRESFLADSALLLVGYQMNLRELEAGLFLFQHDTEKCGTSLALKADQFVDLYDGPIFTERKTGSDECPEFCLYEEELGQCANACECAFVRKVLQIVQEWPKRT